MTAPLDVEEWLRRLDDADVEYVIIGGFAVIAHGVVRATKDLDVCPDPDRDNLTRLAGVLADVGARQVGEEDLSSDEFPLDPANPEHLAGGGNFLLDTRIGRLDIMQWVPGMDEDNAFAELAAEAVRGEAFGVAVRVASLPHLRRMKRSAGRPRDLQDLADLDIAHGPGDGPR